MSLNSNQISTLAYSLIFALSVTACGGGGSSVPESIAPPSSPASTSPTTPTTPTAPTTPIAPPQINWNSSAGAEEVFSQTTTLQQRQRRVLQNFTVSSGTMNAELIFVSQYSGNVYIMPAGEAQKFVNGSSFNYYPALSMPAGKFGFISIDLSIGDYAVGVENSGTAANTVRVELQRTPKVTGFHFRQERFATVTESLKPGSRFTQPVTTGSTYRTVIDGANTGGSIYLIPQSEVSKFMANLTFSYYTDQPCGSGSAAPGFCELKYAPGTYVIAYVNDTSEQQSIVMYGRDYIPD